MGSLVERLIFPETVFLTSGLFRDFGASGFCFLGLFITSTISGSGFFCSETISSSGSEAFFDFKPGLLDEGVVSSGTFVPGGCFSDLPVGDFAFGDFDTGLVDVCSLAGSVFLSEVGPVFSDSEVAF